MLDPKAVPSMLSVPGGAGLWVAFVRSVGVGCFVGWLCVSTVFSKLRLVVPSLTTIHMGAVAYPGVSSGCIPGVWNVCLRHLGQEKQDAHGPNDLSSILWQHDAAQDRGCSNTFPLLPLVLRDVFCHPLRYLVARDPVGIIPLYIGWFCSESIPENSFRHRSKSWSFHNTLEHSRGSDGSVQVASELKALHKVGTPTASLRYFNVDDKDSINHICIYANRYTAAYVHVQVHVCI